MTRIGVDTNVLVSYLVTRDPEQRERGRALFAGAARGDHRLVLPAAVVSETVWVLCNSYRLSPARVSRVLREVTRLPGVEVEDRVPDELWELWPRRVRDFGDACLLAVAQATNLDAIASFDRAFARAARRLDVPVRP